MADGVRAAGIRFGGALGPMAAECAESKYGRVPHRGKTYSIFNGGKDRRGDKYMKSKVTAVDNLRIGETLIMSYVTFCLLSR